MNDEELEGYMEVTHMVTINSREQFIIRAGSKQGVISTAVRVYYTLFPDNTITSMVIMMISSDTVAGYRALYCMLKS